MIHHRQRSTQLYRCGLMAALFLLLTSLLHAGTNNVGLLVPAYFSSATAWNRMAAAARRVPLIAILNPNSGPGSQASTSYQKSVNSLRSAGGQAVGYVSTRYAARPTAEAEADVAAYYQWYALDGIFLDEMTNASDEPVLSYYASLTQRIHTQHPGSLVIANPGTQLPEVYRLRNTADLWVTFESDQGYPAYRPDAWVAKYPAKQFAHLVYAIPAAQTMTNDVRLACERRAGWIYVTDDSGANPWDTLPTYWDALVDEVERINLSRRPQAQLNIEGQGTNRLQLAAAAAPGLWTVENTSDTVTWQPRRELYFRDAIIHWEEPIDSPAALFRLRR